MPQKILSVLVSLMLLVVPVAFAGGQNSGAANEVSSVVFVNEEAEIGGVEDIGWIVGCIIVVIGIGVGSYVQCNCNQSSCPNSQGARVPELGECIARCMQRNPGRNTFGACREECRGFVGNP